MHNHYLCSFSPICRTTRGREAVTKYAYPPFIDGSCRREPDLQNEYPSISALCRRGKFAPRLHAGDGVIYVGKKARYPGRQELEWPLVAMLQVKLRLETHEDAAAWYQANSLPLPSNCLVKKNPPLLLDQTSGPKEWWCLRETQHEQVIRKWDAAYRVRKMEYGVFLVCSPIWKNVFNPIFVSELVMQRIMGRYPGTQNPPKISAAEFAQFQQLTR